MIAASTAPACSAGADGLERWSFGDDPARLRAALGRGAVLVVPTESSYGLAVDPRSAPGVEAIYRIKRRDRGKPLPVVAADLDQIASLGLDRTDPGLTIVARHWPAALSIVLPVVGPAEVPAAAGTASLAVRIPAHDGLRRLLVALGTPLTATSANESGTPPIRRPSATEAFLADADVVWVDGGELPGGPPSTLVRSTGGGWTCLRPGAFDPTLLTPPTDPGDA